MQHTLVVWNFQPPPCGLHLGIRNLVKAARPSEHDFPPDRMSEVDEENACVYVPPWPPLCPGRDYQSKAILVTEIRLKIERQVGDIGVGINVANPA